MSVRSLCLSGGGVAGFVHVGVLSYLHENNLNKDVDTIVCTSVGSIVGALHAIGMTPEKMWTALCAMKHTLLEYSDISRFFLTFGMDSGEYMIAHLVDVFLSENVSPLVTFAQIANTKSKRLIITGTNVSKHETIYFSPDTSPDMRVLDAIRISVSIPFLFSAARYDGNIFADGGIMDNYPLQFALRDFEKRYPSEQITQGVLGSYIENMNPKDILHFEDYIYNIFACCLKRYHKEKEHPCTIYAPLTNVSSIDFSLDTACRRKLHDIGYAAAAEHFQTETEMDDSNSENVQSKK